MCSCGGVQNTRISSSIIASASFSEQSRELPTVSVDVNCTHTFLVVRTTQKLTKRLTRRLARWLQLAHQTRGGEYRLGLTGALDEGMRCWLKRGFGGRSIVESMWRLIPTLELQVAETYPSSPGLQKSSRSAGSKALAISRNQQRTGKKTASHRQARRRSLLFSSAG